MVAMFAWIVCSPAWALVVTYTNRPAWEAAVGPRDFEENFESFASDIDFSFSSTSAPNGFSLSHSGSESFRNRIDVPPLEFADGNGTKGVSTFVGGGTGDEVTITPDLDLIGFGFEVSSAASGEGASVTAVGPGGMSQTTVSLTGGINDFFGFQATGGDRIVSIQLMGLGGSGEGFYMDNMAGVFIPEPSTFVLLGMALAAVAGYRSRRQFI
jgi:hypothetical protein